MKQKRRYSRRTEWPVLLLILVFAFLAVMPSARAAVPRIYRIQYTPTSDGVHMVIGFEGFGREPSIQIVNGKLGTVSILDQGNEFHGAIAFRLNWCDSRLLLDGRVVAEQRCLWLPVVRRLSSESLSLVSHLNRPRVDRYYSMASCVGMEL